MADQLNVTIRQSRGTRNARRERKQGHIPAVLYGHGQESLSLSVPHEEIEAVIRRGSKVVDLRGDVNDSALIREIQWDAFGADVLHLDLTRVSKGERVETQVAVELRGEAPGAKEGGIVEQVLHEVEIECPVGSLPDRLEVNINELGLGQSLTAAALELPAEAVLRTSADSVLVQCAAVAVPEEEEAAPAVSAAEPEIIGRKAEEAEEEES